MGKNPKMLDFDIENKTTGSRFVFIKNQLPLLERALSNFMLDTNVIKNGYQQVSPSLIASLNPPNLDAIIGFPIAIDSSTARPNPSAKEG